MEKAADSNQGDWQGGDEKPPCNGPSNLPDGVGASVEWLALQSDRCLESQFPNGYVTID
ncbi:MAG: hypothetical protein AAF773_20545 [Cyanobacteria bacterium P01_D01_bin.115]